MPKSENENKDIFAEIQDFFNRIMPTNNKLFNIVIIICVAYIISSLIQMFKINLNLSF